MHETTTKKKPHLEHADDHVVTFKDCSSGNAVLIKKKTSDETNGGRGGGDEMRDRQTDRDKDRDSEFVVVGFHLL